MSKLPSAIKLYKGVSIYKVSGSPFWYVRVWDRKRKKYVVKSTGEESSLLARDAAQDLALDLLKREKVVEAEYTFKHFGLKMLNNMQREARLGNKSPGYVKSLLWAIQNAPFKLSASWSLKSHLPVSHHPGSTSPFSDLRCLQPQPLSSSLRQTMWTHLTTQTSRFETGYRIQLR